LIALVPFPHDAVDAFALEFGESIHDRFGEQRRRRIWIGTCSAIRLRYDLIDDVEAFQLPRGELKNGRGSLGSDD
jgi:hypothetical protein